MKQEKRTKREAKPIEVEEVLKPERIRTSKTITITKKDLERICRIIEEQVDYANFIDNLSRLAREGREPISPELEEKISRLQREATTRRSRGK